MNDVEPNAANASNAVESERLNQQVLKSGAPQLKGPPGEESLVERLDNPDKVIKTVLSRAKYAADYRRPFEEEWHRSFLAMFQVFATQLEGGWKSQRYMPLILSNVETAISVIGTVVIDGQKLCRFQGKTPEGRDCARAHEALLDTQNKGPGKYERHILDAEWWGLVTGTAMLDTGWTQDKQFVVIPVIEQDAKGENYKIMREKEVMLEDHPFMKALNPLDVYLCPHSGYGVNHEWVIMRARTTLAEVKAAAGKGHISQQAVDAWIAESKPTDGNPANVGGFDADLGPRLLDIWLEEVGKSAPGDQASDDEDGGDDKLIELLIYRSRKETITLGSTSRILGYSKNKMAHREVGIVTNPYIPIKGCPYGRGLAGVLLGHQELLNANANIFADVMMVSSMRPLVVDRSLVSVLDDEEMLEPNSLIRAKMNARDAIVPLDIPAPTNLFLLWDNHLKKDADDTGGFTEQARGISPANSPTATEFSGVQANIQNRLKIHVLRLKWFVEDACGLIKKLNEQFVTQEQMVSVIGEDGMSWRKIKPWELVGDVLCQATTSPKYANPDLHVQRQLQILQILIPLLSQGQMNPPIVRLLRGILRTANVDDVDLILPAGMETVKSWRAENQAMLRGLRSKPSLAEVRSGQSPQHIDGHAIFLQELEQDPDIPEDVKNIVREHIAAHEELEQQFGQAAAMAAQGGGMAGAQTDGAPVRQEATALGQAQGGGGLPGQASPGPTAPMGRPMGG